MNWQEIIIPASGIAVTIASTVFTYALNKFVNYLISKMDANEIQKKAFDNLLEGMAKAQEDLVRQAKIASSDGKLSSTEIEKAKQIAWAHCIAVSEGPVKDIVLSWSKDKVSALIKELLVKVKSTAA